MQKRFRAWDGQQYWYSDDNLFFINEYKITDLRSAEFNIKDLDMFIGKMDSKGRMIYENDLLKNIIEEKTLVNPINRSIERIFQVIWSDEACGFRKVPYGLPFPKTKIDEAFMEVVDTINSWEK